MIKLLDIVKEVELKGNKILDKAIDDHDDMHYKDHLDTIKENIDKALETNDAGIVHYHLDEIMKHATSAQQKLAAKNVKSKLPTYVNSNISNSYAGDDSDITSYVNQPM